MEWKGIKKRVTNHDDANVFTSSLGDLEGFFKLDNVSVVLETLESFNFVHHSLPLGLFFLLDGNYLDAETLSSL